MKHFATTRFWTCYKQLPERVRLLADKKFKLLKSNPRHPSLHFKKIGQYRSVRVGHSHRALATEIEGGLVWFWIGTHAEYDELIG